MVHVTSDDKVPAPSPHAATPKRRRGRVWPLLLALLLATGVATLWARSRTQADVAVVYTPAGNVQGVASDGGRVYLVLTDVSFGRERGLTADAASVARDEFGPLRALIFDDVPAKSERLGFGVARGRPGDLPVPGAIFVAVRFPHWAALAVLLPVPLAYARRGIRRWTRRRRGLCLNCGYDLRESKGPGRCPECGEPVAA